MEHICLMCHSRHLRRQIRRICLDRRYDFKRIYFTGIFDYFIVEMHRVSDVLDALIALQPEHLSSDDCNALLQMTTHLHSTLHSYMSAQRKCANPACKAKSRKFDRKATNDLGLVCNACEKSLKRKRQKIKE